MTVSARSASRGFLTTTSYLFIGDPTRGDLDSIFLERSFVMINLRCTLFVAGVRGSQRFMSRRNGSRPLPLANPLNN